jgi:hypothetical protein
LNDWTNFFLGELGAAAALAGLLFVAVSVNQARILQLGRMADRALEALVMLLLVLVISSVTLIPGQSFREVGIEILILGAVTLAAMVPLQRSYMRDLDPSYRRPTSRIVRINRLAVGLITLAGIVITWRGDDRGLYLLPPGILLSFLAAMVNTWVLLIEINR